MVREQELGDIAAVYWGPFNRKTEKYAERFGASLHYVHYLGFKRGAHVAMLKYFPQFFKTLLVLIRRRPSVIYVGISPVFAALSVYVYCLFSQAAFIMDVHNHALYGGKWRWSIPLVRFLARRALVNIVDQVRNEQRFKSWGARVIILERPPKSIPNERLKYVGDPSTFSVTVINTFSADEPLEPIFGAANQLPEMRFFVLGDTAAAEKEVLRAAPPNVVFTGFLFGDDYWNQLYSSRAIIALTTADYSLLSAAVEAMAVEKPPILSRQPTLTTYFTKGTLFVDNTTEGIVNGLSVFQEREECLIREIGELRREKVARWDTQYQELLDLIRGASCRKAS